MCVVKDLMKENYVRPFFVCSNKTKTPALSGLGVTLNRYQNQTAATTFRAPYVKSRKKETIKITCSSIAPEIEEDSCNYFEWVPEEDKQKTTHHTGFAGYSEWAGEEQTNRRTNIVNPIPFKDGFCGTVLF